MENQKNTSVFYNGLLWGLILGFISIIYSVFLYMTDQTTNTVLGLIAYVIVIVVLVFAFRSFRDSVRDGVMPFGTAFGFGLVTILVSGLLGSVYGYIQMKVIDPEMVSRLMDTQMDKAIAQGRATEEQIEQGFQMISWIFKPFMATVMGFISSAFIGTIIVLIMAAIFKREEDDSAGLEEAAEDAAVAEETA